MFLGPGALLGPGCLLGAYSSAGVGVTNPRARIVGYGNLMRIKRGDLAPDLVAELSGDEGPADLTTATQVRVLGVHDGQLVVHQSAGVTGSADGLVTMPWPAGTTNAVGMIGFEFEVTWPGQVTQTFPSDGQLWMEVTPDLG